MGKIPLVGLVKGWLVRAALHFSQPSSRSIAARPFCIRRRIASDLLQLWSTQNLLTSASRASDKYVAVMCGYLQRGLNFIRSKILSYKSILRDELKVSTMGENYPPV